MNRSPPNIKDFNLQDVIKSNLISLGYVLYTLALVTPPYERMNIFEKARLIKVGLENILHYFVHAHMFVVGRSMSMSHNTFKFFLWGYTSGIFHHHLS